MAVPNEHLPSAGLASKQAGSSPMHGMVAAAACLFGTIVVYSACLLQGEPFYGLEEPEYVLAMQSLRLAWALTAAAAIGLLLRKGLPSTARGWRKVATAVLIAPYAATALCCATNNQNMLHTVPTSLIEVTFWPALSALLAHALLAGGRPPAKGAALYFAVSLALIGSSTCIERYQHDYVEFFFMAVVSIGVWFAAMGGSRRFGGRGRVVLVIVSAGLAAAWLAIVMDWRFWDILGEPGYASVWCADRVESLQRFLTLDIEGWDCVPERNGLFLVSNVAGPAVAAVYAACSIASASSMAITCGKLACLMKTDRSAPDTFAIHAHGIAYSACIVLGLAANLLNISTCIGVVQWLGAVPASMALIVALLGKQAPCSPDDLSQSDGIDDAPETKRELDGCEAWARATATKEGSSAQV